MRRFSLALLISLLCSFLCVYASVPNARNFEFDYQVTVSDIPSNALNLKIWIPYLPQTSYQIVEDVATSLSNHSAVTYDKKYSNKILYYSFKSPKDSTIKIDIRYKVKRYEYSKKSPFKSDRPQESDDPQKYLAADRLVTMGPQIKTLATEITSGKKATMEKAKAIYDYVFENITYDKKIPGWGNGDTERVCLVKAGNCTDFHSLFISLARASGIPAKFVIGTSIPKEKQGEIKSYHCWAEFYDEKLGWVPVDISEAWKDKTAREYFFGTINEDRLEFTHGRDIVLEPSQSCEPLNYFVYPYVELDGAAFKSVDAVFRFKDISDERG